MKFEIYTGINDVPFSLSTITPPTGLDCYWWSFPAGPAGTMTGKLYGVAGCPGVGGALASNGFLYVYKLTSDGRWYVWWEMAGEVLFFGNAANGPSPIVVNNNYSACGQHDYWPNPPQDGRETWSCAYGGTASIAF